MKLLIFPSTWECTQQRIYVNVTTRVRTFEINWVIKPIKMYTLVKIHSHVPNLTEFIYKIVLTLSIWENTREKPHECNYCGKTLDQILIWHILKSWLRIWKLFKDLKSALKVVLKKLISEWSSIFYQLL